MTARDILKQYFGYDAFLSGQEEIIEAILGGRDVLAVMPTGAGKSVCYQVPALLLEGITLVISPLISLMQDQVKALNEAGIHAAYINSSLSEGQTRRALQLAAMGAYKLIYVAPERLETGSFLSFATNANISMVTVDEAHCISQWGQDFRPGYLKIAGFVQELKSRPILTAFTATATQEVQEDIRCSLGLREPKVLVTGFDRPNLYFAVENAPRKDTYVLQYLQEHPQEGGIIYCATRKAVDALYERLLQAGISVARYHAGMGQTERRESQSDFVYDRTQVMVATNAFGMGIDKSNVRFVIHYNMPQCMENYYQEAGRAGRDGEAASCILLFSPQDVMIDRYLLEQKDFSGVSPEDEELIRERDRIRLRAMERYCQSGECLRKEILRYFGETLREDCGNCSGCRKEYPEVDMTDAAKWIINCVAEARGRFGINIITGTLVGANRARLREVGADRWRSYGKLQSVKEPVLKMLIPQMVQKEYLIQTVEQYPVLRIGPKAMELRDENVRMMMKVRESAHSGQEGLFSKKSPSRKGEISGPQGRDYLTSLGFRLFDELRSLRTELARAANLPPYIIFSDRTLIDMCVRLPADEAQMLEVSGVARTKFDRYGEQFLEVIRSFCAAHRGETISTYDGESAAGGRTVNGSAASGTDEGKPERENIRTKRTKKRLKPEFVLSQEDAAKFEYTELCYVSEIAQQMNAINTNQEVKKISAMKINAWLKEEDLIRISIRDDGYRDSACTEAGKEMGIISQKKLSSAGIEYTVLKYTPKAQRKIVEHYSEKQEG